MHITYTFGCNPAGLPTPQQAYLQATKDAGLEIDALALMTMNMGGTDTFGPTQTAIAGGAKQLVAIYGITFAAAMNKMVMLPSIGVDNFKLVTNLTTATARECSNPSPIHGVFVDSSLVAQTAKTNGMAGISYWSFNRDFAGGSIDSQSLLNSSSPDQKSDSEFFTTFKNALDADVQPVATSLKTLAKSLTSPDDEQPGQKNALPAKSEKGTPGSDHTEEDNQ